MATRALIALVTILVAAAPAQASRAEMEGRGLPRLLVPDESNLGILPGSIGSFPGGVLVDWGPNTSTSFIRTQFGTILITQTSDRFFSAITSGRLRWGYVLDGNLHNLILGGDSWGVTLGFGDSFEKEEGLNTTVFPSETRTDYYKNEVSARRFRVGLGWRTFMGDGRRLELGIGGTYLQTEFNQEGISIDNAGIENVTGDWKSDPGLGFDVTLRSLPREGGLLVAGRFRYEDLNPNVDGPIGFDPVYRGGEIDLGWRLANLEIDDLVVGIGGSLSETATPNIDQSSTSLRLEDVRRREYGGFLFVSGEHEIRDGLLVRGGVRGGGQFLEERLNSYYESSGRTTTLESSESDAGLDSPEIFLGAGYRYRSLRIDAQVRDSINLDSPFIRWSVRLDL